MKRFGAVLIALACLGTLAYYGVRASGIRFWPSAISQTLQAPPHVAAFAEAQCRRDPAGLVAHGTDLTLEVAQQVTTTVLVPCQAVRYLGSVQEKTGPAYIFVLTDSGDQYEEWWVYSTDDAGMVTGVK